MLPKRLVIRMRKRLISPILYDRLPFDAGGLDVANLGMVEITSEDEAYPIDGPLPSCAPPSPLAPLHPTVAPHPV
jgi:hypothetical protein